ncbi:hypothetical protein BJX96DRAFT_30909 [Aspergillus floccosus]
MDMGTMSYNPSHFMAMGPMAYKPSHFMDMGPMSYKPSQFMAMGPMAYKPSHFMDLGPMSYKPSPGPPLREWVHLFLEQRSKAPQLEAGTSTRCWGLVPVHDSMVREAKVCQM